MVRLEVSDGSAQFYEGDKGSERMVRKEYNCDTTEYFVGNKTFETLVSSTSKKRKLVNRTCSICFEDKMPTLTFIVPCGHTLCSACADKLKSYTVACPECRASAIKFVRAYL